MLRSLEQSLTCQLTGLLPGERAKTTQQFMNCSAALGPRRLRLPGSSFHTNIRIEIGIMVKQTEDNNRVAELEAQVAQLKTELAALRPAPKPALKPYVEEGTRVTGRRRLQPPDFPSQAEARQFVEDRVERLSEVGAGW